MGFVPHCILKHTKSIHSFLNLLDHCTHCICNNGCVANWTDRAAKKRKAFFLKSRLKSRSGTMMQQSVEEKDMQPFQWLSPERITLCVCVCICVFVYSFNLHMSTSQSLNLVILYWAAKLYWWHFTCKQVDKHRTINYTTQQWQDWQRNKITKYAGIILYTFTLHQCHSRAQQTELHFNWSTWFQINC